MKKLILLKNKGQNIIKWNIFKLKMKKLFLKFRNNSNFKWLINKIMTLIKIIKQIKLHLTKLNKLIFKMRF